MQYSNLWKIEKAKTKIIVVGYMDENQNKTLFEWDSISTDSSEFKKNCQKETLIKARGSWIFWGA